MDIHYVATHRNSDKTECGISAITSDDWSDQLHQVTCEKCLDKVKNSIHSGRFIRELQQAG